MPGAHFIPKVVVYIVPIVMSFFTDVITTNQTQLTQIVLGVADISKHLKVKPKNEQMH